MTQEFLTTHKTDILSLHNELQERKRVVKAIKLGGLLAEIYTILSSEEFTTWVVKNMPFSDDQARSYISLYNFFEGKGEVKKGFCFHF